MAADGDKVQAATLLKSIDDLKRLKTTRERYQLLQLLVDQDQPKDAERRALRWIRSAKDDSLAIGLIDVLARSKFPESALEVAKDTGDPGDSISLTVAERLIEKTQNGAAQLYLRGWLEQAKNVAPETAVRFVEAALAAGDPRIGYAGARQFGFVQLPEQSLQKLALALEQMQAKSEAAGLRAALSGGAPLFRPQMPDRALRWPVKVPVISRPAGQSFAGQWVAAQNRAPCRSARCVAQVTLRLDVDRRATPHASAVHRP